MEQGAATPSAGDGMTLAEWAGLALLAIAFLIGCALSVGAAIEEPEEELAEMEQEATQ